MSYETQDLSFVFDDEGLLAIGEACLEVIREQCDAQIDANGESTKGDWSESGDLLSEVFVTIEGEIVFAVPYAEHVNAAHPFDGISPQFQSRLEEQLQPIFNESLVFKKAE